MSIFRCIVPPPEPAVDSPSHAGHDQHAEGRARESKMRRTLQERLAQLDSCAISDALDRLHLSGVVLGLHAVTVQKRVAGRALTVQLEETDGRAAMRHLGTAAVDASGPGDVIVVAHGGRLDVSGWGGLLSLGATRRGIE